MKSLLSAMIALAAGASLIAGCGESRTDRVGERPGDQPPSASPTTTPPPTATPPPSSSTPSGSPSTGSPSSQPSSPSGTK